MSPYCHSTANTCVLQWEGGFRHYLALHTFSKCVETVLNPLREEGVRILVSSRQEATAQTTLVMDYLAGLRHQLQEKCSSKF